MPQQQAPEGSSAHMTFTTSQLLGPWVPIVGTPSTMNFDQSASASGTQTNQQGQPECRRGEHPLMVSTTTCGRMLHLRHRRTFRAEPWCIPWINVVPIWSDGQLSGTRAAPYRGGDKGVPDSVRDLATQTSAAEQGDLAKARAIERYLKEKGSYSNEDNARHARVPSRPPGAACLKASR